MSSLVYLAEGQFIVILVVENIEQVGKKRMNFLDLGKFTNYYRESVVEILLSKFDFSHIEIPYPRDLIVPMDDSWRFPLGFR